MFQPNRGKQTRRKQQVLLNHKTTRSLKPLRTFTLQLEENEMSSDSTALRTGSGAQQETGRRKWVMKKKGKLGGMGRTDWEQLKWLVTPVWFTPQSPAAEDKIQVCVEMARIREAELIALSPSSSHRCWNCVRKIAADGLTSCFFGKLPVEQRLSVGRRSGWMMQDVHKTLNWLLLWPVKHIYWPSCPGGQ